MRFLKSRKYLLSLVLLTVITGAVTLLAQSRGNPANLRVKVDANGALVMAAASQVNPVTSVQFNNARLATDSSGNLLAVVSGGSGVGTVTSVATTSPITGGTITGTGTIACATCLVSTTPVTIAQGGTGLTSLDFIAYTPTLGAGFALGNGTIAGVYQQIGKLVHFRALFTLGTTSTVGAANNTISLPVTSLTAPFNSGLAVQGIYFDTSAALAYTFPITLGSTTVVNVTIPASTSALAAFGFITSTTPFTWATGDIIQVAGSYIAN
jgi:hypothetical protein